jgi:hypothetical protein
MSEEIIALLAFEDKRLRYVRIDVEMKMYCFYWARLTLYSNNFEIM